MRWILPLLSLALVQPAVAELAVYTGIANVQDGQTGPLHGSTRVAEVIDLASGKIVTVALTGPRSNFVYLVGPEVQYVVAKATDAKGHTVTAFAQANTATANGATYVVSSSLRGRDAGVTLSTAGSSQWPRTLVGTGSAVATAGTDPATAPASVAITATALTLSEGWSKIANTSGTLTQAANVIGKLFRDRVATFLQLPVVHAITSGTVSGSGVVQIGSGGSTVQIGVSGGSIQIGSSIGLVKTGTGILSWGTAPIVYNPSTVVPPINGGTLILQPGSGVTTTMDGTLQLGIGGSGVITTNNAVLNTGAASLTLIPTPVTFTGGTLTVANTGVMQLNPVSLGGVVTGLVGSNLIINRPLNPQPVLGAATVTMNRSVSGTTLLSSGATTP